MQPHISTKTDDLQAVSPGIITKDRDVVTFGKEIGSFYPSNRPLSLDTAEEYKKIASLYAFMGTNRQLQQGSLCLAPFI